MKPPKKIFTTEVREDGWEADDIGPFRNYVIPYALITGFVKHITTYSNQDGSFSFVFILKNGRLPKQRYKTKKACEEQAQKFADALGCDVREVERLC